MNSEVNTDEETLRLMISLWVCHHDYHLNVKSNGKKNVMVSAATMKAC